MTRTNVRPKRAQPENPTIAVLPLTARQVTGPDLKELCASDGIPTRPCRLGSPRSGRYGVHLKAW